MKSTLSKVLAIFSLAFSPISLQAETPNRLSDEEKAEGWKLLFDGSSLDQWKNYRADSLSELWKVEDGYFVLTEKGGGDIVTKEQFGEFDLTLDFKISYKGNSGLMFHVQESEATPWMTGPEAQILDDATYVKEKNKTAHMYALYPSEKKAIKPWGEWNTLRLVITKEKCTHYLNGVKMVEYVKGSADWDAKVAASKFKKFPKFGKFDKGHIALQDHGNVVAFRNVKIRSL